MSSKKGVCLNIFFQQAIFFAVLEEKEYDYDPDDETKLDTYAKAMLAGECHDRWFDKSFTMVFAKNGRVSSLQKLKILLFVHSVTSLDSEGMLYE